MIGDAIAQAMIACIAVAAIVGLALGAVIFWLIPMAWPHVVHWLHAITA